MHPVPVQRSRIRRGVSLVSVRGGDREMMQFARWVVHVSVSGLCAR